MANRFAKSCKLAALLTACGLASEARSREVDFATEVLPILRANCVACHNDKKAEGGLSLESPSSILKGGEQGPAVVVGKGAESLLLKLAAGQDTAVMPPPDNQVGAKRLTPEQLVLIKQWIDSGATGGVSSLRDIRWQPLPGGFQPIFATAVSPDGQFAAYGRGNRLIVNHLPSGAPPVELLDAHRDVIRSLAFDAAGGLLASGGFREVKLWRAPRVERWAEWTHDAPVVAVAISGSSLAATGDASGKVRLWDIESGKTVQTIAAHQAAVTGLVFSPDGATLYSASLDKSLRAWKIPDGSPAGKPADSASPIHALALVNQGQWLVTGQADGSAHVWDTRDTSKPLQEIKAHGSAVTALAAVPSAPLEFLTGGEDAFVRRFNAETGKQHSEFKAEGPVAAVAARADGRRIAAAGAGYLALWNADSGKPVVQLKGDSRLAVKVAEIDAQIAFTKSAIALAKSDIKAYEGAERRVKTTAESVTKAEEELKKAEKTRDEKKEALDKAKEGDAKKVEAAEKALDDAETAVVVAGTVIERAKGVAERAVKTLADEERAVAQREELQKQQESAKSAAAEAAKTPLGFRALAFSANGQRLAAGSEDGAIHFFDSHAGTHAQTQAEQAGAVRALAFGTDGTLVSAAAGNRAFAFSAASDWRLLRTIGLSEPERLVDRVLTLDFSPDGRWLVSGGGLPSRTGELKIWNVADGRLAREIVGAHGDTIFAARFSRDGRHIASAGADRLVKVFNAESGELVRTFAGHTAHALGVDWNFDGKLLVSCGGDNVLKLWDFETGLPVRTMKGTTYQIGPFKREVTSVAFIGDSEQILACSGDGTVRLHRTSSENDILTFAGAKGYQYSASVTPDGRTILAGGSDGTLRLWSGQVPQVKQSFP
jgi:WD40 repeat protein